MQEVTDLVRASKSLMNKYVSFDKPIVVEQHEDMNREGVGTLEDMIKSIKTLET